MSLYRRKESSNPLVWYMRYTDAEGIVKRESTKTENKQLAQAVLEKVKAEAWEQKKLGVKKKRLLKEAADLWVGVKRAEGLRTVDDYERQIEWWCQQFKGKHLHEITQEAIIEKIEQKRKDEGCSPATMNRYLAALRGCLRLVTLKYRWIGRDQLPSFFLEKEPPGRVRWLKPDEVKRLLEALPDHWRDIAGFALATGQRLGNVLGLRWDQVDLQQRTVVYEGTVMKNGETHGIGLSDVAVSVIQKQVGKNLTHVFSYRGRALTQGNYQVWHKALEKAGIEDFRIHDLRHTWASMMVQSGVTDGVLMALGSWKTPKMVKRYAHHHAASLIPFAQVIDGRLGAVIGEATKQQDRAETEQSAPVPHLRSVA